MAKFDYQITSLVTSIDEDLSRIMTKVYNTGFDSFTVETFPNGTPKMARFHLFAGSDEYTVDIDANGNLGEVIVR